MMDDTRHSTTESPHPHRGFVFPEQRLIVAYEGQELDAVAREALEEGWVLRRVPLELASCDPDRLARHVFEVVRERVLELGPVR